MNKIQSSLSIGTISGLLSLAVSWQLAVVAFVINTIFIYSFLTMKGH